MKRLVGTTTGVMIGAMLVLSGVAWSGEKGKMKKNESTEAIEMAAAATVTIDQSIKAGSEKVTGKVVEAELEKQHDKPVWEIKVVTAENTVIEVHINAGTGAVIDVEEETPENDMKRERKQERQREHQP